MGKVTYLDEYRERLTDEDIDIDKVQSELQEHMDRLTLIQETIRKQLQHTRMLLEEMRLDG